VTGDTINTGARLKASARDDQILVSPDTQRRIAPFFELEVLPPAEMKGKADTMTPYRVVGETAVKTRFEASERRGLSRHVGRERELEVLRECLQQAEQGQGQVVAVVGEAGLGKTRLVFEFRTALDLTRVNQVRGRCGSTGATLSYLPFVDLFQRWFRIRETDSPGQVLEKAERSAQALAEGLEEHLPALLHLLSIPSERQFPPGMAGEAIHRKIEAALKAFLAAGCKERPLVMIFEDLHWADENSEAMLQQYIESISTLPVMLLLNYRPEYRPPWGHYSHLTPLALKPLSEENTGAIVASALKVDDLPEGLAPVVHARAEGNPFFAEELALSLEEEGVVERKNGSAVLTRPVEAISFPDTVQAVVRARVDRLPEASRDTLRLASVVGREFTESLVSRLSESADPVTERLGELKSLEMILEKRFQPELEFMFKHAITHQVAYDSLLLSRRKALHTLVGLGIEELYTNRLPEFYEMLAHHFEQGEVWDKAVDYLIKAGTKSRKNFALNSASLYLDRAREILERERPQVSWRLGYDLLMESGTVRADLGQLNYSYQDLKSAWKIAQDQGDARTTVPAMFNSANAALNFQKPHEAIDLLNDLEPMVADEPEILVGVLALQALSHAVIGNLEPALAKEKKFRQLIPQTEKSPYFPLASFVFGLFQRWQGNLEESADLLEANIQHARESATAQLYLQNLFIFGLSLGERGRYQDAIRALEEGRELGLNSGEKYVTPKVTNSLGWAYHELCLYNKAIHYNSAALDSVKQLLGPGTSNLFEIESQTRINLGENHLMHGEIEAALEHLELVYENARKPEYFYVQARWLPRCLLTLAELWLHQEDLPKAQAFLDEAIDHGWIDKFPYKKYRVRAGRLRGNILAAEGSHQEAEAELKKALALAKKLGNPTQLWRTQQALGNLYQRQDKAKQAQTQYKAALKVVQGMADGLTDQELKDGFLTSEPIREVFAQAGKG
jgi:tetratricopeptide (TPR) repeat protein